ncbi:hypothetical protein GYMLUDRAFT_76072 [Collybiopsis luxurians FD-317 M1]|uniref:HMG box domain-containing protein n=1 Tax=Collybiopsis luxurians FD-317 M1 TaxID=944289 RepID=A0A0D0CES5_9AGAR|nr:hypothetical protein GYMLUDRAFT_76072 [Collybiopsis luxurians FD-317 M1]
MTSQYSPVDAPNGDQQERTSQSPSDDASNDGDSNQTLTSQTLNADGTPKRPMNAFMIFARRRRPQVSSENQSMRTGEISKILSKEWNSMPPSEKQFYLDRAKELKETFNNKYPDYVYRRRPNNSRRKRKDNNGVHSVDGSGPSPTDPHSHPHLPDPGMPRQPYDDHIHPHHRSSGGLPGYGAPDPYARESSSRQHPYLPSDRGPPPPMNHNGPLPSPRLPGQSNSIPALHSYLSSQNIPSGGHMYPGPGGPGGGSSSSHSHSSWDHPRLDTKLDGHPGGGHGRSSSAGSGSMWPGSERSSSRGYPGQSGSPTGSVGPGAPNGSAPNGHGHGHGHGHHAGSGDNFPFPSLNSPSFFPTPSQMFNSSSNSPTSSTGGPGNGPSSASSTSTSAGGPGGGGGGVSAFGAASNQLPPPPGGLSTTGNTSNARSSSGGYDVHRSYAPSPPPPSLNGAAFAQSASRHGLGGGSGMPRSLPPVQSIPGYNQPGLGNGHGGPPGPSPVGEIGDLWSRGS